MMVTMPHGDTSSYAVTQARSQEPTLRRSVTPTSRSATLILPSFPDGSQLAATLRPQGLSLTQATWKHSHCKACRALHFDLPGFQRLISQWKRLPVVLHVCLPCSRPCDHVANIWPVGGKQRQVWQVLGISSKAGGGHTLPSSLVSQVRCLECGCCHLRH